MTSSTGAIQRGAMIGDSFGSGSGMGENSNSEGLSSVMYPSVEICGKHQTCVHLIKLLYQLLSVKQVKDCAILAWDIYLPKCPRLYKDITFLPHHDRINTSNGETKYIDHHNNCILSSI